MTEPQNVFDWSRSYFRSEDRALHETKATMAALMTYADFNTLTCFPSQTTLSRITGLHIATIRRHIQKNVNAGWLTKLEQGSSYKRSTTYKLTIPDSLHPCKESTLSNSVELPAPTQGVEPTPSTGATSTPSTDAGSTPCTGALLTTHRSTHTSGSSNTGTTYSDPFSQGSGIASPPIDNQSTQPPAPVQGVAPRTDARSSSIAEERKRDLFADRYRDPFADAPEPERQMPTPVYVKEIWDPFADK